jgi:hypothetical protein
VSEADVRFSLKMRAIAEAIDDVLADQFGERIGFILITAPFDRATTEVQYVANVERGQGIDLMNNLYRRWSTGQPDIPTHEKQ